MSGEDFSDKVFTATKGQCPLFTRAVLHHVHPQEKLRVLEIGCGTGEQLFDFAEALPHAELTGVDISEPNLKIAESSRRRHAFGKRVSFVGADYMKFRSDPFDLIFSHTTLHLVPGPDQALFTKLANDMVPGGFLMYTMPYACVYNTLLFCARRFIKAMRSPVTDKLVLGAAKLLHDRHYSGEMLRDRVLYMYSLPERMISDPLNRFLEKAVPLDLVEERPIPQVSPAQARHKLMVFRKRR